MSKMLWLPAFFILMALHSNSQVAVEDSLRLFYEKMRAGAKNCAPKSEEYKNRVAQIALFPIDSSVHQLRLANKWFLDNKPANCTLVEEVRRLDTLLKAMNKSGMDTMAVRKAMAFMKYHFAGFISLRVSFSDSTIHRKSPLIQFTSFEPAVRMESDTAGGPFEMFLRPGKDYSLRISAGGYAGWNSGFTAPLQDTQFMVTMVPEAGGNNPAADVNGKGKSFQQRYLWAGLLLLVLGFISGWLLQKQRSRRLDKELPLPGNQAAAKGGHPDLESSLKRLQEELRTRDNIIDNNRKQIERLHAAAQASAGKRHAVSRNETTSSPYFVSEIMMTAGPRKKPMNETNSDKDLGEDVCGFVMAGSESLVWLLDGTSDFYCLRNPDDKREYFSSRLLAQSVGRKLKEHFSIERSEPLDRMMTRILDDVSSDWNKVINSLPGPERELLKQNIREGNFPECAATILIARLSLDGSLEVYRSGDSKLLLYTRSGNKNSLLDSPLSGKNPKSNDRVFFRILLSDDGILTIMHNQPLFEIVRHEHVQAMIGFSDGIGKETEEELMGSYASKPGSVREEIIYQLQGTEDDKALCIIEIVS